MYKKVLIRVIAYKKPFFLSRHAQRGFERMPALCLADIIRPMNIVLLDRVHMGEDIDYAPFADLAASRGGVFSAHENTIGDEEFLARCTDAEVIITNRVALPAARLEKLPRLTLIALTATGFNTVDLACARTRGIAVANVPAYSTQSVAQFTFSVALPLIGRIMEFDAFIKDGSYSRGAASSNVGLRWRELSALHWGVIGLGAIGSRVAELAQQFGARVSYYSTSGKNNNAAYERLSLAELLSRCDVVSVHAPLSEATRGLLDAKNLALMKSEAVFINVGRGGIADEAALAQMINEKRIGGVGLDVFEREPLPSDHPLLHVKYPERLIMAPHVAWASAEARTRLMQSVYENIRAFAEGARRNRVD